MNIAPKKISISVGVVIELSSDEATHLSYALSTVNSGSKLQCAPGKWPWLNGFIELLDKARGSGCSMGGRLTEFEEVPSPPDNTKIQKGTD